MSKNQFGGFGGGNIQQLMRQAQKMQEQLVKAQEELEEKVYSASSGGGAVVCELSGKLNINKINIKKEVVDPDDVEMLEDLVVAAVNEAIRLANEDKENTMGQMAPKGMGGLF